MSEDTPGFKVLFSVQRFYLPLTVDNCKQVCYSEVMLQT